VGIKWRKELNTGIELIDNQHKELFSRFDRFLMACEAGHASENLNQLLDFLASYVQQHFSDEEELQKKSAYPGYEEHAVEHASFVSRLERLQLDVACEGVALHHVIDTNGLLFKWIVSHISSSDKVFGSYLSKQPLK
jgi:hemerythrin